MWSHGSFFWNELMTRNVEGSKQFYGATLGWIFESMPIPAAPGTYWIAKMGDAPVAGLFEMTGPDFEKAPETWFAYIAVDNVDSAVKKVTASGGKVLRGPFDIENVGRLAIVEDNSGVMFGFMTPKSES